MLYHRGYIVDVDYKYQETEKDWGLDVDPFTTTLCVLSDKLSGGWGSEKPKTKIRARENVPPKNLIKVKPKGKKFIHDKVLNLCAPRLKSGAKEARLIIT